MKSKKTVHIKYLEEIWNGDWFMKVMFSVLVLLVIIVIWLLIRRLVFNLPIPTI